ncbi:antigen 5 like allergen Cul n 1-like [Condylostylus longicornis]|uniref:antigen 5 like allergen Cul n 1-like n=1 Tax=Condylostylus longicornis TaxID=2530218 RepID=UPI00244DF44C|nr:antigen 5 like allergen Cul n 1-like [Condylostylus longicornis]
MTDVCPNRSSIACKYVKNPGVKCKGAVLRLNKAKILHWHNARRNLIALGKISKYKPAKRMGTMKWSKQLERMAMYNVMTCKFQHDKCRNTRRFPQSGQNIYLERSRGKLKKTDVIALNGIKAFFAERKYANMKIIKKFPKKTRYPVGHFTSMIKYNSDYVGCAMIKFRSNGRNKAVFACNYASTNIYGRPTYVAGRAASGCKKGRNKNYKGLCSNKEVFSHFIH